MASDQLLTDKKVLRRCQPMQVQGMLIDQTFFVPNRRGMVEINDPTNPRAMINLVPDKLRERLRNLCAENKMFPDEGEIRRKVGSGINKLIRLRYSFFENFCTAQDTHFRMRIEDIIDSVCSYPYWYKIEADDMLLAFVMSPPTPWHIVAKEMLHEMFHRLQLLLKKQLSVEDGKEVPFSVETIKAFRELAEFLLEAEARPVKYNLTIVEKKSKNKYTKRRKIDSVVGDTVGFAEEEPETRTAEEIEEELLRIETAGKDAVPRGGDASEGGDNALDDAGAFQENLWSASEEDLGGETLEEALSGDSSKEEKGLDGLNGEAVRDDVGSE